ncbi:hypothetical protein C8Q76DRAFT_695731 [Earliella scabrosa]|nr:hypothetical protein C8Q76DRAFT_695731 [Earliella scabrosa]
MDPAPLPVQRLRLLSDTCHRSWLTRPPADSPLYPTWHAQFLQELGQLGVTALQIRERTAVPPFVMAFLAEHNRTVRTQTPLDIDRLSPALAPPQIGIFVLDPEASEGGAARGNADAAELSTLSAPPSQPRGISRTADSPPRDDDAPIGEGGTSGPAGAGRRLTRAAEKKRAAVAGTETGTVPDASATTSSTVTSRTRSARGRKKSALNSLIDLPSARSSPDETVHESDGQNVNLLRFNPKSRTLVNDWIYMPVKCVRCQGLKDSSCRVNFARGATCNNCSNAQRSCSFKIKKQRNSSDWSRTQAAYVLFKWASTAKEGEPQPGERPPPEFDGHPDFSPPKWFMDERSRLGKGSRTKGRDAAADESAAEDVTATVPRGAKKKRPRHTAPASEDESLPAASSTTHAYGTRRQAPSPDTSNDDPDASVTRPVKRARSHSTGPQKQGKKDAPAAKPQARRSSRRRSQHQTDPSSLSVESEDDEEQGAPATAPPPPTKRGRAREVMRVPVDTRPYVCVPSVEEIMEKRRHDLAQAAPNAPRDASAMRVSFAHAAGPSDGQSVEHISGGLDVQDPQDQPTLLVVPILGSPHTDSPPHPTTGPSAHTESQRLAELEDVVAAQAVTIAQLSARLQLLEDVSRRPFRTPSLRLSASPNPASAPPQTPSGSPSTVASSLFPERGEQDVAPIAPIADGLQEPPTEPQHLVPADPPASTTPDAATELDQGKLPTLNTRHSPAHISAEYPTPAAALPAQGLRSGAGKQRRWDDSDISMGSDEEYHWGDGKLGPTM